MNTIDLPGIGKIEVTAAVVDKEIVISIVNKTAVNIYVDPVTTEVPVIKPGETSTTNTKVSVA